MDIQTLLNDPEKAKARYHELNAQSEALHAKLDPIRAKRNKLVAKHAKEMAAINKEQAEAGEGLFAIEQERALIAKVVGNVGEPE
jgi:cell division protein FtsB